MNCAMISLPLPLSPVMNTDASVAATRRASEIASRKRGAFPRRDNSSGLPAGAPPFACCARFARDHDGVCRPAHQNLELGTGERFGEIVPRTGAQRLDARLDARLAGDDDGDRVGVGRERRAEQLHPRDLAHVQIDQDDVERPAPQQLLGFLAPPAYRGVVAIDGQRAGAALA